MNKVYTAAAKFSKLLLPLVIDRMMMLRQLVLDLVKLLQEHGFNFVTSLNLNGGADTMFFEQTENRFRNRHTAVEAYVL
jgi:hypothetical protein